MALKKYKDKRAFDHTPEPKAQEKSSASGRRTGFGALLLGYYQDQELIYVGRVGTD